MVDRQGARTEREWFDQLQARTVVDCPSCGRGLELDESDGGIDCRSCGRGLAIGLKAEAVRTQVWLICAFSGFAMSFAFLAWMVMAMTSSSGRRTPFVVVIGLVALICLIALGVLVFCNRRMQRWRAVYRWLIAIISLLSFPLVTVIVILVIYLAGG